MENKKITRNGLPTRYAVEGMQHLCVDEAGMTRIKELREKFVGKLPATPEVKVRLKKEMSDLMTALKHQGHLFRRDGAPLI